VDDAAAVLRGCAALVELDVAGCGFTLGDGRRSYRDALVAAAGPALALLDGKDVTAAHKVFMAGKAPRALALAGAAAAAAYTGRAGGDGGGSPPPAAAPGDDADAAADGADRERPGRDGGGGGGGDAAAAGGAAAGFGVTMTVRPAPLLARGAAGAAALPPRAPAAASPDARGGGIRLTAARAPPEPAAPAVLGGHVTFDFTARERKDADLRARNAYEEKEQLRRLRLAMKAL